MEELIGTLALLKAPQRQRRRRRLVIWSREQGLAGARLRVQAELRLGKCGRL